MNISSVLSSYLSEGKANWNDIEISEKFLLSNNDRSHPTAHKKSFEFGLNEKVGLKVNSARTFVFVKDEKLNCSLNGSLNGCPLLLDDVFSTNDSSFVGKSKLLDIATAQVFISCLVNSNAELVLKLLPLIIFCDGFSNKENIFMLILEPRMVETSLGMRKAEVDKQTVVLKTVTCEGTLSSEAWILQGNSKMDESQHLLHNFIQPLACPTHLLNDNGMVPSNFSIALNSFSVYELLKQSNLLQPSGQAVSVASISLEVSCSKITNLFSVDCSDITSIAINVSPVPGDLRSPAISLFQDIKVLEGLLEGFGSENHIIWADYASDDDEENDTPRGDVKQNLRMLLESFSECTTSQSRKSQDLDNSIDDDDEQLMNLIVPRQELDFTERVWDVLKYVQSLQQLVDFLSIVSTEIKQGKAEQLWLHEDGQSTLAEAVKSSYLGKATNLQLAGLRPLQILLEIGIDKLRRDYVNFFVTHRFCTAARLRPFTHATLTDADVGQRLKTSFVGLQKLHHVLELAAYSHVYLQLPLASIHKIVRSALQEYSECDVDFSKTFSFSASYNDVKQTLDTSFPSLWRMDVTGITDNTKATGSSCWTTDFPFPDVFEPAAVLHDSISEDCDNCVQYYKTDVSQTVYPLNSAATCRP